MFVDVGLVIFAVLAAVDYHLWIRLAWWGIGGAALLLVVVELMSPRSEAMGASRWPKIGGFGIQPSEFTKIAIMLALARVAEEVATVD